MQVLKSIGNRILWLLPRSTTLEGYEHPDLVDLIFKKTKTAALSQEPWVEMIGVDTVLDFGGAFGRHYHAAATASPHVRWAVVETPAIVKRAKEIETEKLRFFPTVVEAKNWLGTVSVVHSNGAVQYTLDPLAAVRELCAVQASKMIWDRVFLTDDGEMKRAEQISLLSENGPGFSFSRQRVRYTVTHMPEAEFLLAHSAYRLQERSGQRFVFTLIA